VEVVCTPPPIVDSFVPVRARTDRLAVRYAQFQRLYAALKPEMTGAVQ
jgi:hypothetical protein